MIIERRAWCDEAERALQKTFGGDGLGIKRQVETGEAELLHIHGYGWLVTRLEVEPEYKELVLVAGSGRGLDDVIPVCKKIAAANGAKFARLHTDREGMGRMLAPHGFYKWQTVYRCEVS